MLWIITSLVFCLGPFLKSPSPLLVTLPDVYLLLAKEDYEDTLNQRYKSIESYNSDPNMPSFIYLALCNYLSGGDPKLCICYYCNSYVSSVNPSQGG